MISCLDKQDRYIRISETEYEDHEIIGKYTPL